MKLLQVWGEFVGNGHAKHLDRSEPRRESTGIVLEQHGEETLNGAEQCTVNHHRTLVGAIGSDVLQAGNVPEG